MNFKPPVTRFSGQFDLCAKQTDIRNGRTVVDVMAMCGIDMSHRYHAHTCLQGVLQALWHHAARGHEVEMRLPVNDRQTTYKGY